MSVSGNFTTRLLEIAFVVFVSCALPVRANDWGSLSGSVALTSDYRFRGVSQSNLRPAPQGEMDWNVPDDWTFSAWASRIDFQDHQNTSIELDMTADKHWKLDDTDFHVEAVYHAYPDHHPVRGGVRYSAVEAIVIASHSWDSLSLNGTLAWSPDNVAETGTAWLVAGGVSYPASDWLSMSANFGRQSMHRWDEVKGAGYPYLYWDVGVTAEFNVYSIDLRYVGTNLKGAQCLMSFGGRHWCQSGIVASMSRSL